jgi:hypothetical protein
VVYKDALLSNIKDMLTLCQLMIQMSPSALWAEAMHASGFFAQLLGSVIEDKTKSDNTIVLVEVLQVFARIILVDSSVFLRLIEASAVPLKKTPEWLIVGFLDQWWNKVLKVYFDLLGLLMASSLTILSTLLAES